MITSINNLSEGNRRSLLKEKILLDVLVHCTHLNLTHKVSKADLKGNKPKFSYEHILGASRDILCRHPEYMHIQPEDIANRIYDRYKQCNLIKE